MSAQLSNELSSLNPWRFIAKATSQFLPREIMVTTRRRTVNNYAYHSRLSQKLSWPPRLAFNKLGAPLENVGLFLGVGCLGWGNLFSLWDHSLLKAWCLRFIIQKNTFPGVNKWFLGSVLKAQWIALMIFEYFLAALLCLLSLSCGSAIIDALACLAE